MLLLAPLLVWVAVHPAGTLPTSSFANLKVRALPPPAAAGVANTLTRVTPTAMPIQRIVQSPSVRGMESPGPLPGPPLGGLPRRQCHRAGRALPRRAG